MRTTRKRMSELLPERACGRVTGHVTHLAMGGALLALLQVAACSKGSPGSGSGSGSPADSTGGTVTPHRGPEQPPTPYAGPFEAHVVARVLSARTALVPLADGRVVLTAGLFRYALGGDGTATLLGDLPSYAARMPPDDSQLGGYDVPALVPDEVVPGARPWLDLRGPHDGRHRPEGWALSDDLDVPADVHGDDLRRAADGTSVLLARESPGEAYVTFVAPAQSRHATRLPIDVLEPARRDVTCEHVPSWGRPHVLCRSWQDGVTSLHRLSGDRWERLALPASDEHVNHARVGAMGPDGALWLGLAGGALLRVAANGASETFDLPKADAALARASYRSAETYVRPANANPSKSAANDLAFGLEGLRRWERISVTVGAAPEPISQIRQIVPRPDGEAWVLATEARGAHVLVHMSRPAIAPPPDPLVVGTEVDQRNELRNLKAPVTWVAHCPQLFVTLARERADGSMSAATVWSREAEIAAIVRRVVGKKRPEAPVSMIVEGRLAGHRVAGVLVWRPEPNASEELLEKTATSVADELATLTGAPPRITCTVPVLERASASLP